MTPKEKKLLRILLLAFLGMLIGIGWLAGFIIDSFPLSPYRIGLRIFCILGELLILLRILHLLLLRAEIRRRQKNWTMVVGSLFFVILLAEIPFMFIPYSHGNGNTYSSRIWFNRYWDTNSLGYRDREPDPVADASKTKLFFLGDSFVAGHGIKDPADRFSDIVASELGEQFAVYNLGRNGADTKDEFTNLKAFPLRPDILILSHIPNDIERVNEPEISSQNQTGSLPLLKAGLPKFLRPLTQGSFFLNYSFWKFNGFLEGKEEIFYQTKVEHFQHDDDSLYLQAASLAEHQADIQTIVDWCRDGHVKLLVLTFPKMYEGGIDFSQAIINLPMEQWLTAQSVPVIHAYEAIRPIPYRDRIVNYNDVHPSVLAHRAVAELLLKTLKDF